MPGLATRLYVAKRVFDALGGVNNGVTLDRNWFMFGAIGPAVGDFVPIGNIPATGGEPTSAPYLAFWQGVLNLAMGTTAAPGLIPTLVQLQALLSNVQTLIDNEDFSGVKGLKSNGSLTKLTTLIQQLTTAIGVFQDPAQLSTLGSSIGLGPLVDSTSFQEPPEYWTGREFLHWKKTGTFAEALLSRALASPGPDARFVSYALGWRVAYATLICGSGFVNSITGSSYRTYWWRSRWISNFIDTWVWGFYNSGASLKENGYPDSDYGTWPSLCNAALHQWIDVTGGALDGPTVASAVVQNFNDGKTPLFSSGSTTGLMSQPLPGDFVDFWMAAWNDAYPSEPLFGAAGLELQTGYVMSWLVLWFQTSSQVIGCLSTTSPQPPDDSCNGSAYSTQQNASIPGQGTPSQLEPTPEHDPNTGETVCGVILAILGVIATAFDPAGGAAAIAGGIALAVDGEDQLNWQQLKCQMYWVNVFMFNALWDLHKVAVLAGLQQPFASDLDISAATTIAFGPEHLSYMSSAATCQGQSLNSMLQPWNADLFSITSGVTSATWTDYPVGAPPETPQTATPPWMVAGQNLARNVPQWPSFVVDDIVRNPSTASILTPPLSYNSGIIEPSGAPASFGPAFQSAMAIINAGSPGLPDWNLDGDRSVGWLTWQLDKYGPYTVPVPQEEET